LLDGEEGKLDAMKKETGFDPRKDVRAAVVALRPKRSDAEVVLIAEATVNEAKLVAFLRKQGKKVGTVQGAGGNIHRIGGGSAFAVRGGFIIAGDEPVVRAALAKRGPSAELSAMLKSVQQRDMFMAARPTAEQRRELGKKRPELAAMRGMKGAADVGADVKLEGTMELASAEAAKKLHVQAQMALALARLAPEARQFKALIDKLQLTVSGREINARLELTEKELGDLLQML
jgi:hypothetical protein